MKYTVHGTAVVQVVCALEAESEAEAIENAGHEIPGLTIFECDGEVVGVDHEEAYIHGEHAIEWLSAEPNNDGEDDASDKPCTPSVENPMSDYTRLHAHVGHAIETVTYGNDKNVSVECTDCNEVLLSIDNPSNR